MRDNAALLDTTSSPEIGAPYGIPAPAKPFLEEVTTNPGKLRIAFFTKGAASDTHPDCVAAVKDAAKLCEELGHNVTEAAPELDYDALLPAFSLVVNSHTAAMLDQFAKNPGMEITSDTVEPATLGWAELGWNASAADFAISSHRFSSTRTVRDDPQWRSKVVVMSRS